MTDRLFKFLLNSTLVNSKMNGYHFSSCGTGAETHSYFLLLPWLNYVSWLIIFCLNFWADMTEWSVWDWKKTAVCRILSIPYGTLYACLPSSVSIRYKTRDSFLLFVWRLLTENQSALLSRSLIKKGRFPLVSDIILCFMFLVLTPRFLFDDFASRLMIHSKGIKFTFIIHFWLRSSFSCQSIDQRRAIPLSLTSAKYIDTSCTVSREIPRTI